MPKRTPWGASQYEREWIPGVTFHGTAGHGGVHLDRKRKAQMPEYMRYTWYEEDCEWAMPVLVFADEFRAAKGEKIIEDARKTFKDYFPDEYERFTGETVKPEESYQRRQYLFHETTRDKLVAVSASGQNDGTVLVTAAVGGRRLTPPYGYGPTRQFIVAKEDYDKRNHFGYVVDPSRDKEVL